MIIGMLNELGKRCRYISIPAENYYYYMNKKLITYIMYSKILMQWSRLQDASEIPCSEVGRQLSCFTAEV